MNEQLAVQNLLQTKFSEIQTMNPRFSLRAFAQKAGIPSSALSAILSGKRNVSRKLAERIAQRLMLDPTERSLLLSKFPVKRFYPKAGTPLHDTEGDEYRKLTAAQFKIVAEWEHFSILSLIKTKDFKNEVDWIARRLGITATKARDAIDRLVQVGMLEINAEGELRRTAPKFRTTDDVADVSLKRSHDQTLDLAKASLHRDDVSARDHTWMTMAIDPKQISVAKELIRKFQDELAKLAESGNQTEVYRLSMQLFPLTVIENSSSRRYGEIK